MGVIMGTAAYMSPEQISGKVVDRRSDIWAYGVVLFEMLTGQKLYTGESVSHVLGAVLHVEPKWAGLPSVTPQPVTRLLRRCLEKDHKRRLRDIGEALIQIEEAVAAPRVEPTVTALGAQPIGLRQALPWVAGFVVGAVVAGVAVWSLMRPGPRAVTRFEIRAQQDLSFFSTATRSRVVAMSPDGRQIVYLTSDGLSLRSLDQVAPVLVAGTDGGVTEPFFNPDGQWIGFWAAGQLRKVATSGGAPVTLGDAENPWGASWGDDDMILYGQGPEGIWRVPGCQGRNKIRPDGGGKPDHLGRWVVCLRMAVRREASGWWSGSVVADVLAVCETIAVAVQLQDVDVMSQPIEQRASQPFGAEDLGPFVEGQIRGHQRRRLLVALGEDLEQQLGAGAWITARSRVRRQSRDPACRVASAHAADASHPGPRAVRSRARQR